MTHWPDLDKDHEDWPDAMMPRTTHGPDLDDDAEDDAWARPR